MSESLIRRIQAKREHWLELKPANNDAPALRVKVRRPNEWQTSRDFKPGDRDPMENMRDYVVDWSGFSEATFLGAEHAAADPIPFDSAAWVEYVSDHSEAFTAVALKISDLINEYRKSRVEAEKNSSPGSSTTQPS